MNRALRALFIRRVSAVQAKRMSAIRGTSTYPEILLRKALFKAGLRYRLHVKNIPGRPDIVFRRYKIIVFCDGDFWHGRNWHNGNNKRRFRIRKKFWETKISMNISRDQRTNLILKKYGWKVLRFWESDIKKSPNLIARKIIKEIKTRRLGQKIYIN